MSIMTSAESDAYKVELAGMMAQKGIAMDDLNKEAFDDMTDFENPNFQYVVCGGWTTT